MSEQTETMPDAPTGDTAVEPEISRYWSIQYGPEPDDDEADGIADIIEKSLKKVAKQKCTIKITADVYVVDIESDSPGHSRGCYDVIAIVDAGEEPISKGVLFERVMAATPSEHRDLISMEFRFRPLNGVQQFEQLRKECLTPSLPDDIRRASRR